MRRAPLDVLNGNSLVGRPVFHHQHSDRDTCHGSLGRIEPRFRTRSRLRCGYGQPCRRIDEWREKTHVIDGPGEYEISGLGVRGIATSMADVNDPRALNTVFILDAELISVCHLGALAAPLTTQAAQLIGHVDVLITPAGGMDQAISADQAAAVTRVLEPRLIIPIHPGVLPGDPVYTSLAAYVAEVGLPMPEPVSRITVTRSNIGEVQRLVVLRPLGAESY